MRLPIARWLVAAMNYNDFIAAHAPQLADTSFEDTCTMNGEKCRFRFNGDEFAICLKCGCARMRKQKHSCLFGSFSGVTIDG